MRHIGASAEPSFVRAASLISVLAGIAHPLARANHVPMRGLRIAAWAVATATVAFLTLGVLDVGHVMSWLPLGGRLFVAAAILAPVVVGLLIANHQPNNRIAWILLLGPFAVTLQLPIEVEAQADCQRRRNFGATGGANIPH